MEQKNTVLTILLILLIALAVFAVIWFNKNNANKNEYGSNSKNNIYEEINNKSKTNENSGKDNTTKKDTCIANFTTNITYPDKKRTHNITTCCNYLNGKVIQSGKTFSFNDTLGPFNEDQGYTESTGFDADGKIIKIIGGGICQVSSTLYNVALNAKLEVIERNEHSAPVDYVAQGKDATICYPYVDLKFKNTTSSDITIKANCNGKQVTVEFWNIQN